MQQRLREWNGERLGSREQPVASGVGIHSGVVMLGTLGSTTRIDSTVIGDAVNLASRLEGLTKYYGVRIVVSDDTWGLLDQGIFESRRLDLVSVKGRDAPVTIREIYQDLRGEELDRHRRLAEVFAQALELYERRHWLKAQQAFRACLDVVKEDVASIMFIERCAYYSLNPPSEDWDGSFVMKSK
jgi:hypothetical protein